MTQGFGLKSFAPLLRRQGVDHQTVTAFRFIKKRSEANMKEIKILGIIYSPGYGDMLGEYHEVTLRKDKDGNWTYVCSDREFHDKPTVTTAYSVSAEAVAQFEKFINDNNVISLEERPKSDMFATDYSPWSWSINYEITSFGKTKREYCSFGEYRRYSRRDYDSLKELEKRFISLRGEMLFMHTTDDK